MQAPDLEKIKKHIEVIQRNAASAKQLCDPGDTTPFEDAVKKLHVFLGNIEEECGKILE